MILSICRTQASVALSSCEGELYAANGLMVECMACIFTDCASSYAKMMWKATAVTFNKGCTLTHRRQWHLSNELEPEG